MNERSDLSAADSSSSAGTEDDFVFYRSYKLVEKFKRTGIGFHAEDTIFPNIGEVIRSWERHSCLTIKKMDGSVDKVNVDNVESRKDQVNCKFMILYTQNEL